MGKGSRNRINRETEPKKKEKKKVKRYRKPLPGAVKGAIASVVCILVVAAIVVGVLAGNGTFKRSNILVKSKTGDHNINQQMATYMVWDALYYTGYYQWSYLSDSVKTTLKSQGISNQSQYCLYYAMSGVQSTLLTSINAYADTLKEYVAVCDLAADLGISLTAEEKKEARDGIVEQINYMAIMNNLNTQGFLNMYIGCNVKMEDIKNVAEMQKLYSKVLEHKQTETENSITETILNQYRDENAESFYSTDYITYSTEDVALKAALEATSNTEAFKTVLVKHLFENGDSSFRVLFNKYATELYSDAEKLLKAVEKKTTVEELNTALTAQSLTAQEYSKSDEALNEQLKAWMFDSARNQFDSTTVTTADALYVVVLSTKPENDQVTAAFKTFALESGETYQEDADFKTNMLNTILNQLELLDSTDGMKLYTDSDDEAVKKILADLKTVMEKELPDTKTEKFTKSPKEGSYQEWMFKDVTESFASPVAAGAVKMISETKDEKETFHVYMIVEPMKLDTKIVVNGGYLLFEGEGHAEKAQQLLDSLNGLTGSALTDKLTAADSDAVVSEAISESSIKITELSSWLFSAERAANDKALIAVADSTPDDDEKNESCSYVAVYLDNTLAWKNTAKNGYTNQTLQDWVKELISHYELTGLNRIKDKNPPETTTTAASTEAATKPEAVTA